MKAIVLAVVLAVIAGCAKHEPKVYTDAQGITHIDRLDPGQSVQIPVGGLVISNAFRLYDVHHHRHFIPLYHRYGTQWLGWLADGRPNERGS